MSLKPAKLPVDITGAYMALLAERDALQVERDLAMALLSDRDALIASLELRIARLRRELRGQSSERTSRLIDQLELQLDELVTAATEDEVAAEATGRQAGTVAVFTRKRPVRRPWPEDIERERVVIDPPVACACCGSARLSKLGEDVTRTLEEIPRRFKVIETVREKFSCRDCEAISQAPAPFHVTPRGFIGPQLMATILFDKFGMHNPLNRQSARFKCEGIDLSTSTLADQVGLGTSALMPLVTLIERHVFAAERLHGDDTTIPVRAKSRCRTGRVWVYVCDDRPYGGSAPPAARYYASADRRGEHPQKHLAQYGGLLQTDCYNGFEPIAVAAMKDQPITFAFCHAHARRKFFELADIEKSAHDSKRNGRPISPVALEAVRRFDMLFEIERHINGLSAEERLAVRQEKSKPLFDDMHTWLQQERATLLKSSDAAKAMDYMLKRWDGFALFLKDGRVCMTNNAAERALRGIALGRRNWTFAGSDRGADRAAIMLTLIMTCQLNSVDPKAWLADVLARIAGYPASRLHELLPWNWKKAATADVMLQAA